MRLRQETGLSSAKAVLTGRLEVVNQAERSSRTVRNVFVLVQPTFALGPGHDGVAHRSVTEVVMAAQAHGVTLEIAVLTRRGPFELTILILHLSKPVGCAHGIANAQEPRNRIVAVGTFG